MTDERTKEQREGEAAFKAGTSQSANPYPHIRDVSVVSWIRWFDGWLAAARAHCRCPGCIQQIRKLEAQDNG